jgi:uncharacterized protein YceK
MKKILSIFLVISIISFLSGCSILLSIINKKKFEETMNATVGLKKDDLIEKRGLPTETYTVNGKEFLTWKKDTGSVSSGTSSGTSSGYGSSFGNSISTSSTTSSTMNSTTTNTYCNLTFILIDGVVNTWKYDGNNCW